MKKLTKMLAAFALLVGVFGVDDNQKETTKVDAVWENEAVRVYLDKTSTIAGLGWWKTDDTFIHIWDGTINHYEKMIKVDDNLFYYEVSSDIWSKFTDATRGIEFYVYNTSSNQNQTYFTDGLYLKTNELNYFKLNSVNGSNKQSYDIKNKEVEETIEGILLLTCESTPTQVQNVVNSYNALRSIGKSNLNTWTISDEVEINGEPVIITVTFYERLAYLANLKAISINPAQNILIHSKDKNLLALVVIGFVSLTSITGYYFLKTKKFI